MIAADVIPPPKHLKEGTGLTLNGEGHINAHDTRHDFIPCQMVVVM